MIEYLYQLVQQTGYNHPLHPAATHLPVGCIMAAFFFVMISRSLRKPAFYQSARHCIGLALLFLPITALLGYMDWQHSMAGAMIWPIKIKLVLAGCLFLLLVVVVNLRRGLSRPGGFYIFLCLICLALVTGLGYYGGEIVYATKSAVKSVSAMDADAQKGAVLFQQKCSFCHLHDQTATKVGPGLKGLTQKTRMPTSRWPLNEQSIRKQIVTPFKDMPPFESLTEDELNQLVAYLKTL